MKKVYITWHYTTHGIAYMKHILSAFYINQRKNLEQERLNKVFDEPRKGFRFDEIIYLTAPQDTFDKISSRRFEKEKRVRHIAEETWEDIHYHTIKEQIEWLTKHSNFKKIYKPGVFKEKELKITNLRSEKEIAEKITEWARAYFKAENEYTIDVSLGTSETQVVWYILAEKGILPRNTRFIKTYDNKTEIEHRFKSFNIEEAPTNLIRSINVNLFEKTASKNRMLANEKMKSFMESGFSILLIGDRGTGKSQMYGEDIEKINCASFTDDDKAEAELFGVKKGTYTGVRERIGVLEKADGKKLFLDEIHRLSKAVQAKLMTAFGTDRDNYMKFFKLGDLDPKNIIKVKCQLIFATNKKIDELRNDKLLPDFYDRIVQNVIEIPSLEETPEDREQDWENIWKQMKFNEKHPIPKEPELINWLKELPLYGNFRDLQKIAIYYNDFINFNDKLKKMIPEKTPFKYAKNEFEKWKSPPPKQTEDEIDTKLNTKKNADELLKDFKFELQERAIKQYGSRKEAAKKLCVEEKTLNNWKNRKESQ